MGKEITHITKLFRKQNLEGAFKTKNNIGKVLNMNKVALQRTKYEISGVYQFRCPGCNLVYTGQTGRQFKIRYYKHLLAFNNNNNNNNNNYYYYALAQYVIKMGVPWETLMTSPEKVNTLEKYSTHLETNRDTKINDKNTVLKNRFFDILIHCESGRGLKRC